MQPDEATNTLLKQKGLTCICQLCDCGRPHRHHGCTKNVPSMLSTLQRSQNDAKTYYQTSFGQKQAASPTKCMLPPAGVFNPNPPQMDFRTTNRSDFKKRGIEERAKPVKLQDQYEGSSGPFYGDSAYQVDYPGHKPAPISIERPSTQKAQSEVKFEKGTMYSDAFQSKKQTRQEACPELPSFAYSILYPDRSNPTDKKSFKNAVHSGTFAARPNLMAPKESTVQIGTEGDHEHTTTSNTTFVNHADFKRERPVKRVAEWKPRVKFCSTTQAQEDFKSFGKKMPLPRKTITPPPETINLAMDNNRYLQTTNSNEHKINWEINKLHRPPLKKSTERYTPPKQQFQTLSVMQQDFKPHNEIKPVPIKPLDLTKSMDAKFFGVTSYNSQFPKYDNINVTKHGDLYDQHYYVKPLVSFVQDSSVTRGDYKSFGNVKPLAPILPENKRHTDGGKFFSGTSYSEEYTQKAVEPCVFSKLIAQKDAKSLQKSVVDYIHDKSHQLPNVTRKTNVLAVTF